MYTLDKQLLCNYAKVMVHYAINNGNGIKKGETVFLMGQEHTKDLYMEICKEIWTAGGNVIMRFLPDDVELYGMNRTLLEIGSDEQLAFFPSAYWRGVADAMDHLVMILSDLDARSLAGISPHKVTLMQTAKAPFMKMRAEKESRGAFSWTLCLYPMPSMAKEAGLSIEEYWEQLIDACYLKDRDPVARWKQTRHEIGVVKDALNALPMKSLRIEGDGIDLSIRIGERRQWLGATGHNIPSFEIFTSPDWRGTNGTITFNEPLYHDGQKVEGINLTFQDGVVTRATATKNERALLEMIAVKNANKVGEFSLTDKRHSRITRFMAHTLLDENRGGGYGNTHIALGDSYRSAYSGNGNELSDAAWEEMGYNNCPQFHADFISTVDRKVTATTIDGGTLVIYEHGQFTLF